MERDRVGVMGALLDREELGRVASWYGLRNMSVVALSMFVPVPMAADAVLLTGSSLRFWMKIDRASNLSLS